MNDVDYYNKQRDIEIKQRNARALHILKSNNPNIWSIERAYKHTLLPQSQLTAIAIKIGYSRDMINQLYSKWFSEL